MMMWNKEYVKMEVVGLTEQEIRAIVEVRNIKLSWFLSAIYASPRESEHRILWDNLKLIANSHDLPWFAVGDFNKILNENEKWGGNPINISRVTRFSETLDYCSFIDLGFVGPRFTWSNLRQQFGLIQERIDRAVANPSWRQRFPNAEVTRLPRMHSDHCPPKN